jgi:methylenetetrahydrofolate dehydrogenase (NADP+)/methenyltetrahydrofolate cyclohydrolase/formyltetrahydrofolate synthetase
MANLDSPDAVMVSTALGRLEKLRTDEYIIAFGPNGRQFFATPNGYSA